MWRARQAELLREEIEKNLGLLADIPDLYKLAREPLAKTHRGLASETANDRPWPLIPLLVCEAISGLYKHALPAAAAIQFLKAAGDVFDDIEDDDSSESLCAKYGPSLATNAANTLLILAERSVTRLKEEGVTAEVILRIMETVNTFCTTACAGQHLDISLPPETAASEDTYLSIAGMKSASQVECACCIGAILAGADKKLTDAFSQFGHSLGLAAQITNDVQGITLGRDILKPKITLPVIYALAETNGEAHEQLQKTFVEQSADVTEWETIKDLIFSSGAIYYTMIKIEQYKKKAHDTLAEAERSGSNVERLKIFLK